MLYNDYNLLIENQFKCDTPDDLFERDFNDHNQSSKRSSSESNCIPIYIEVDYALFTQKESSVSEVEDYLTGMFNEVSTIFFNEQINISISEMFVHTSPDPYVDYDNTEDILDAFIDLKQNNFNGRFAHLVSSRLSGNGRGSLRSLCRTDRNHSFSGLYGYYNQFPTYSKDVFVFAHETGHNFRSPHTHTCFWGPNGDQAIDNCWIPEGDCSAGPPATDGGTIMSYCFNVNFSLGFGSEPGQLIRDNVSNAICNLTCNPLIEIDESIAGNSWRTGSTYDIIWYDNIIENVKIDLYKEDSFITTISTSTLSDSKYEWTIPGNIEFELNYKIKITSITDANVYDFSDVFTIIKVVECTQCNIYDWTALKAIYESTGGENWTDNTGWDTQIASFDSPPTNCDLSGLFGVTLLNDGCVRELDLSSNNLTGYIPPEIGDLTNLRLLNLSSNPLSGTLPADLGKLSSLYELMILSTDITGSIPPELGNCISLWTLVLNSNELTGTLPPELGKLNVGWMQIAGNNLQGSIPKEFGSLSRIRNLALSSNQLSGSIPFDFENLRNLESLSLGWNQLTGTIPQGLGNLEDLEYLSLPSNQLEGSVPPELANLENLVSIQLSNNSLSGCYDENLNNWCGIFDNVDISDGNNFDVPYEEFCNTGVGDCTICIPDLVIDGNIETDTYKASNTINSTGNIIPDQDVKFEAGGFAKLNPGFHATAYNGSTFVALINDCQTQEVNNDPSNCEQTINLNAGWNLISFDVSPEDDRVSTVFGELESNNLQYVTSFETGAIVYKPDAPPFLNTLKSIKDGSAYWVRVQNADQLTIDGICLSENFRKPLNGGWNLVAYIPDE